MKNDLNSSSQRPIRILFLAWGFSIHAKRRIQIFIDDPSFEVAVVSTHNYNFKNAKNILLTGHNKENESPEQTIPNTKTTLFKEILTLFDLKLFSESFRLFIFYFFFKIGP